jgi:uncharacterized MAPEG superfamily protein
MSTDLMMLTLTAALTALMWLPYILQRIVEHGLMPTVTYAADDKPIAAWAERAKRAHRNAVENLAPFAALVLVAQATGASNAATAAAATVYFWIRLVHYAVYIVAIPFARTLCFTIGWVALMVIFYQIVT